jgi:hypothetical protein
VLDAIFLWQVVDNPFLMVSTETHVSVILHHMILGVQGALEFGIEPTGA